MSEQGQKLIEAIRVKAEANPAFVYSRYNEYHQPACVYVADGKPSCLVGHGLWDLGLIDAEFENVPQFNEVSVDGLAFEWGPLNLDDAEIDWLRCVQARQDEHYPWADAVAWADDEMLAGV